MHRLEICVSSWCTHIFKAIEIVDGHLAHQRNQVRNANSACLTTLLSATLTGLNVISGSWSEILCCQLPFYRFVFTSAENTTLLPGLHVRRNARQQSLMKILSLGEREVFKAGEIQSRRDQEEGGELDSHEEASPKEIKIREVVLGWRERELDFFCFSCFPTAELRTLSLWLYSA